MDSLLNAAQWARITVCFARLIGQGGGGGGGPPASIATKKLGLQDDTWPCMSHERKCVGAGMRVSVDIRVRVSGGITAPPSSAGAQLTLTPPPKVHVCQISGDSWSRWLRAAFRPSRETKPRDPPPKLRVAVAAMRCELIVRAARSRRRGHVTTGLVGPGESWCAGCQSEGPAAGGWGGWG